MKKITFISIFITMMIFVSCTQKSSEEMIQTAIAETASVNNKSLNIPTIEPEGTSTPIPTRTPLPTKTPENKLGSRSNPFPLGEPAAFNIDGDKEITVAVVEVLRGDDAWGRIHSENMFNDEAPEGFEYLMIKLSVNYITGPSPDVLLELANSWQYDIDMAIVSNNKIVTADVSIVDPEPEFDLKLYPGSSGEGYVTLLCEKDDPNPILVYPGVDNPVAFFSLQ